MSTRKIGRILNQDQHATTGEAVAFWNDEDLGPGSTFEQWTGERLPIGMEIAPGLFVLPGRKRPDGFVEPMTEPVHPGQLTIDDAVTS